LAKVNSRGLKGWHLLSPHFYSSFGSQILKAKIFKSNHIYQGNERVIEQAHRKTHVQKGPENNVNFSLRFTLWQRQSMLIIKTV